jgi:rhamnopyranosyl-N-acetylglucosaminyl-diphospho-decaprenol beta-1,3/1,4-galactofuranosyltransferase
VPTDDQPTTPPTDQGTAQAARVVAVVLTYRRTDLLRRSVDAVVGQTRPPDLVLVVDNDRLAGQVLSPLAAAGGGPPVEVFETGENLGPAGGYEVGLREALDRGATKVWTVDDDLVPERDCLERLLEASQGPDVLIPLQRKPGFVKGHPPSWNGTLFDAAVVLSLKLPRGDLFFWAEDTEFYQRIRKAGFAITPVPGAAVFHVNPEDRRRGSARDWRLYYEVRNGLYVRLVLRPRTAKGTWRAWRSAIGKLGAIVVLEPHKARSMRLWWRGYRDYRRRRLGKVVAPETWPG